MNISLRKANVLQTSINDAIKDIKVNLDIELSEFQSPAVAIETAQQEHLKATNRRNELLVALYEVRKLVAEANHISGIQNKLTQAALLDKQIGYVTEVAGGDVVTDMNVIEGKLNGIRNQTNTPSMYGFNRVSTSILTTEHITQAKLHVLELKKAKQKINDEILELNISTKITLGEAVVKTLQSENLL